MEGLNNSYTFPSADKTRAEYWAINKFNELLKDLKCTSRRDYKESDFKTIIKTMFPLLEA